MSSTSPNLSPLPSSARPSTPGPVTDGSNLPLSASDTEEDTFSTEEKVPSFSTHNSSTTLVLKPKSLGGGGITVFTSSNSPLYNCELHSVSKPHVVITSAKSGDTVASIVFHAFSKHTTLTLGADTTIEVEHKAVFKSGYQYHSAVLDQKMEWKAAGKNTVLVDGHGNAVAKFGTERAAGWRERILEIREQKDDVVLEVLVSALAVLESRRRNAKNSAITGGVLGV